MFWKRSHKPASESELEKISLERWTDFVLITAKLLGWLIKGGSRHLDIDAMLKEARAIADVPMRQRKLKELAVLMDMQHNPRGPYFIREDKYPIRFGVVMVRALYGTLDDLHPQVADAVAAGITGCFLLHYHLAHGKMRQELGARQVNDLLNVQLGNSIKILEMHQALIEADRNVRKEVGDVLKAQGDVVNVPRMLNLLGYSPQCAGDYTRIKAHEWWGGGTAAAR